MSAFLCGSSQQGQGDNATQRGSKQKGQIRASVQYSHRLREEGSAFCFQRCTVDERVVGRAE